MTDTDSTGYVTVLHTVEDVAVAQQKARDDFAERVAMLKRMKPHHLGWNPPLDRWWPMSEGVEETP